MSERERERERERRAAAHALENHRESSPAVLLSLSGVLAGLWLALGRWTGRGQVSVRPCQLDRMLPRASVYAAGTWTEPERRVVGCTGMHAVGWPGIPAALPRLLPTVRPR